MAKGTKGKKRSQSGGGGGVDDRFASARFDPRFSRFPAKKKKKDQDAGKAEGGRHDAAERAEAEEDPRFSDILKRDKRFAVGTSALKVDKRGRERPGKREKEDAAPREADEEKSPARSEGCLMRGARGDALGLALARGGLSGSATGPLGFSMAGTRGWGWVYLYLFHACALSRSWLMYPIRLRDTV